MFRLACALVIAGFTVAGCGIGEGVGAIIGAVIGLSIVEGALIGAGGLTGMLTAGSQVNLGDPVWKKKQQKSTGMDRSIQIDSATLGYGSRPGRRQDGSEDDRRDHSLSAAPTNRQKKNGWQRPASPLPTSIEAEN